MRVIDPMPLDFAALADGVIRNNVGVAGMHVECAVSVDTAHPGGPRVLVHPTGQAFRLDGLPPATKRARFTVLAWDDPARTALRVDR